MVCEKQRLPRGVFRRSIAWLSDSLSTLRGAGYPNPTQDSLPAVGRTLLDGIFTRRVPLKGFRVVYISFPLPKLLGTITSTAVRNGEWIRGVRGVTKVRRFKKKASEKFCSPLFRCVGRCHRSRLAGQLAPATRLQRLLNSYWRFRKNDDVSRSWHGRFFEKRQGRGSSDAPASEPFSGLS